MDKIDWFFERVLWPIMKHVMGVTTMIVVICYVLVGLYDMGWIS
jgi:uncharacterized membrane protein YuzA (DUF378 family)